MVSHSACTGKAIGLDVLSNRIKTKPSFRIWLPLPSVNFGAAGLKLISVDMSSHPEDPFQENSLPAARTQRLRLLQNLRHTGFTEIMATAQDLHINTTYQILVSQDTKI